MPKTPYKKAKDAAWKAFSDYIRTRDCLKTTGTTSECYCVTCGIRYPYKEIQAGHALGGRNISILFDEELVNGQCRGCNGPKDGNYGIYSLWFIENYGLKAWEEKVGLQNSSVKLSVPDLRDLKQLYKDKLKQLLDETGNNK